MTILRRLILVAALCLSWGCGDDADPTPVPAELAYERGSGQSARAGQTLADSLGVRVLDTRGRPAAGVEVSFVVVSGGGQTLPGTVSTGADGFARAAWRVGGALGEQRVEARAAGVQGNPVSFVATVAAGPAAQAEKTTPDGTATVGSDVRRSIRVTDSFGNPVPGVPVAWAAVTGAGALVASDAVTQADGTAGATWRLGPVAGPQTMSATVAGVPVVVFSMTTTASAAAGFTKASGDAQTGAAGQPLPGLVGVRVADAFGNPVAGAQVTWRVVSGGGSTSPAQAVTGPDGLALATWTLGGTIGMQRLEAVVGGTTLAFTATATAGAPANVETLPLPASATVATDIEARVRVTDAFGNPVAGAAVGWTPRTGAVVYAATDAVTGADGIARATWRLATQAGMQALDATVGGRTVTFSTNAVADVAWRIVKVSGDQQPGAYGQPLAAPLVVRVVDAYNNPIPNFEVLWAVVGQGAGTVTPTSSRTNAEGFAQAQWTLGSSYGSVRAFNGTLKLVAEVTFTAAPPAGSPARVVKVNWTDFYYTPQPGTSTTNPPTVRVTDANGRPLPGVAVSWLPEPGDAATPSSSTTDAEGLASTQWTIGSDIGQHDLRAFAAGTDTAVFSLSTGRAAVFGVSVSPETADVPVGEQLQLQVRLFDSRNKTLTGRTVTWTSSDRTVAEVTSSGLVLAYTNGTAVITAQSEGKQATSTINVTNTAPVFGISMSPMTANLNVGGTVQLQWRTFDARNKTLVGRAVTFTSSNPAVATVNSSGFVTAVGAGKATITATVEGKFATTEVTVSP